MKSSKIYIAGHTGLVGSAILRCLKNRGYSNFVFTPFPEYDLTDQKTVELFFRKEKPEYVFLAAARVGGIVANNTYRADFIYENLQIQNNVIHHSYLNSVKKLIFLGSSCIYPKNAPQPMNEDCLLTSELEYTNEPYAIAKIAGLKMCESYNIQYGTNFIAAMPTNLFGPNDNFDLEKSHVLPAFIRKLHLAKCLFNNDFEAIRNDFGKRPVNQRGADATDAQIEDVLHTYGIEKDGCGDSFDTVVKLWGTGNPRREFLYSDDLADALVFLMEQVNFLDIVKIKNLEGKPIKNTQINIGAGMDISIKELAFLIKDIVQYDGEIKWDTTKPDGTFQKLLDVSVLNKLGWRQKISFKEGIKMVYTDYVK